MNMLTIKNAFKLAAGVVSALTFSSQALAVDIELTGSYGNYLQAGCGWSLTSSNNYGPNNVPSGATTNAVTVDVYYLNCSGSSGPQAVKVIETRYTYTVPYWSSRIQTGQSCSLSAAQASVVGTCESHRVYQ